MDKIGKVVERNYMYFMDPESDLHFIEDEDKRAEEIEIYKKTKLRLQNLKADSTSSLQDLTVQAIVKRFIDGKLDACILKQISSNLPPFIQDLILQGILQKINEKFQGHLVMSDKRHFELLSEAVMMFTTSSTYNLDLSSRVFRVKNNLETLLSFNMMLLSVSTAAKRLKHLRISDKTFSDLDHCKFGRIFLGHLSTLQELKILEFVKAADTIVVDLAHLCSQLPNLQVLSVNKFCLNKSDSDEEIRKSYGHLRLLEYTTMSSDDRKRISQVLPHLDVVNYIKRLGLTLDDFLEESATPRSRRYFHFKLSNESPGVCCDLSTLRHVEIDNGSKYFDPEEIRSNVESLTLNLYGSYSFHDSEVLKLFPNLRQLYIHSRASISHSVDINTIARLCSKLEVLHLNAVFVSQNPSQPMHMGNLIELRMEDNCYEREYEALSSLYDILSSAPKLKTLKLMEPSVDPADLQKVEESVIKGEILVALETLHVGINGYHYYPEREKLDRLISLSKHAAAYHPLLKDLRFCHTAYTYGDDIYYYYMLDITKDRNLVHIVRLFE